MKNNIKKLAALLVIVAAIFALTVSASAVDATAVTYDKVYYDSISSTDKDDYYSFSLGSYSKLTIGITTTMRPYTLTILDANQKEVWSETVSKRLFEDVTDDSKIIQKELEAGNYFLKITSSSTGSYNLKLTYVLATKNNKPAETPETDADKNNKIEDAKALKLGSTASGKLLKEDERDYYKFTLSSSGSLDLKITSYMRFYSAALYKENADKSVKKVWSDDRNEWDSSKKTRTDTTKLELSKGVYYLEINGYRSNREIICSTGKYSFKTTFKSAGSNEEEPNDSIVEAKKIKLEKTYVGHLSLTDSKDFFEITVKKGTLAIGFVSKMSSYNIYIYDETGKEKWSSKGNSKSADSASRSDLHKVELDAGKYYIRVDGGKGSYSFKLTQNATVAALKSLKYSRGVTTITLKWKKATGASGYEVHRYDEAKKAYVKVGSTKKTSLKIKNLKGGTTYKFMVKPYKSINGLYVYGKDSEITATTGPAQASIKSVKAGAKNSKQVTVTWNPVTGADGYRIYYSLDKDFETIKKVTVKDAKAVSQTIKKLKKGKKYYFRVRAFKKIGGKTVWGAYSKSKSVKVK